MEADDGVTHAYRRFGNPSSASPALVFLHHFRGNIDNWDPLLVDTLAAGGEVIVVDDAGVGLSTGAVPHTITEDLRAVASRCTR